MQRYNASRGSSTQQGYGSAWRAAAEAFLEVNPFCVDRSAKGCLVFATEVDHEKPHKGDHELFWDRSNWRPRCKPCHSRKTATRDGGFGR